MIQYDLGRPLAASDAEAHDLRSVGGVGDRGEGSRAGSGTGHAAVVAGTASVSVESEVKAWRESLVGQDVHSRVLALVGTERWGAMRLRQEAAWRDELDQLARDVLRDGSALTLELGWLASGSAHAAGEFGAALGRADAKGVHFDRIMATARPGEGCIFAAGYASGLVSVHAVQRTRLAQWIDGCERNAPDLAADVAITAGPATEALTRVLRLFDAGRLPARYLYARNFPTGPDGEIKTEDLITLLERLAPAAERGDGMALRIGLESLAMRLPYEVGPAAEPTLSAHPVLRTLAWKLFDAVPNGQLPPTHWWGSLVGHLSHFEPMRAARYLARLVRSETVLRDDALERALTHLAARSPVEVMDALGEVMLDDAVGFRFFIGDYEAIFAALPDDVKREWLERVGVEGARRMARHVAPPHVTENGEALVPPFTAWFLERFGDDDRTFHEFLAGTRSWRSYWGDIAAQHDAEAAVARRFLGHPLARVREWARMEEKSALAEAAAERMREAEQDLP